MKVKDFIEVNRKDYLWYTNQTESPKKLPFALYKIKLKATDKACVVKQKCKSAYRDYRLKESTILIYRERKFK